MSPTIFARLEEQMPDLLAAIRTDLEVNSLWRVFQIAEFPGRFRMGNDCVEYFESDIPKLFDKVHILQNRGLVARLPHDSRTRYAMTEEFVEQLLIRPTDAARPASISEPQLETVNEDQPNSIGSDAAVNAVRRFLSEKKMTKTQFASRVGTTGITVRKFLKTGQIRRSIFESIAHGMGLTSEELLRGGPDSDMD